MSKERKVVIEKRVQSDGKTVYDAKWFHNDYTDCPDALKKGRRHCTGHKKGTCGLDSVAEAQAAGYAAQNAASSSSVTPADSSITTMDDIAQKWFDSGPPGIKSPKTLDGYRERWRAWKNRDPMIGLKPVTKVESGTIHDWIQDLRNTPTRGADGPAYSTMRQDLILLGKILGFAVTLGFIKDDPTERIKTPTSLQGDPEKREHFTESELWNVANAIGGQYETLVLLGAYTGLRLGELLGLRAENIDRRYPGDWFVINVVEQWDEDRKIHRLPKRDKTRQVPVPKQLGLERIIDKHLLQYPASEHEHGLVFASEAGTPILQSNFRKFWYRAQRELGLEHRVPHSMRNSFVDTMLSWEVPPYIVQAMAGHKNNSITLDVYAATGIGQIIAALEAAGGTPNTLSIADATAIHAEHGKLELASMHSDGLRHDGWLTDPEAAHVLLEHLNG